MSDLTRYCLLGLGATFWTLLLQSRGQGLVLLAQVPGNLHPPSFSSRSSLALRMSASLRTTT
eukprot:2326237-Heterocapsa_arctica.AAC.1